METDYTGKILVSATWGLFVFANYVTVTQIFNSWFLVKARNAIYLPYSSVGSFLFILYELLNFLAATSHVFAVFGDPGTTRKLLSKDAPKGYPSPRICKPCGFRWKPPRAHHCRKCKICIFRMDHHCAWIDNCVGILNQKFFILFLIYSAILCGYQLLLILLSIFLWIRHATFSIAIYPTCLIASVVAESLIFLHMTTDIFSEQLDALETNSSLIESHQHTHGRRKPFWSNVADVFGKNRISWLLPVPPKLKLELTEPVFLDKAIAIRLAQKLKRKKSLKSARLSSTMEKVGSHETPADSGIFHRKPPHKKNECVAPDLIPENPLAPPLKFDYAHQSWPHDAKKTLNQTHNESMNEDVNNSYEESVYQNVYLRPWIDVGVELDDDSRFVQFVDTDNDDQNRSVKVDSSGERLSDMKDSSVSDVDAM